MKNKLFVLITMLAFTIIIFISFYFYTNNQDKKADDRSNVNENDDSQKQYDCLITKTYRIVDMLEGYDSDNENYSYITIDSFQDNVPETVKVMKSIKEKLKVDDNYEFTFQIEKNNYSKIKNKVDLFEKSIIMDIVKTEKFGMEQIQDSICK